MEGIRSWPRLNTKIKFLMVSIQQNTPMKQCGVMGLEMAESIGIEIPLHSENHEAAL